MRIQCIPDQLELGSSNGRGMVAGERTGADCLIRVKTAVITGVFQSLNDNILK
jgi:hypothetical protein